MDDKKKELVKRQAKEILDNFAKAMSKVKISSKNEKGEVGGFREEGEPSMPDADFRSRMFANAPNKDENCIIAEKA
ncbi:MAG: hypothetical protein ACRDE5_14730, partial [Ginsengibacter sp.]